MLTRRLANALGRRCSALALVERTAGHQRCTSCRRTVCVDIATLGWSATTHAFCRAATTLLREIGDQIVELNLAALQRTIRWAWLGSWRGRRCRCRCGRWRRRRAAHATHGCSLKALVDYGVTDTRCIGACAGGIGRAHRRWRASQCRAVRVEVATLIRHRIANAGNAVIIAAGRDCNNLVGKHRFANHQRAVSRAWCRRWRGRWRISRRQTSGADIPRTHGLAKQRTFAGAIGKVTKALITRGITHRQRCATVSEAVVCHKAARIDTCKRTHSSQSVVIAGWLGNRGDCKAAKRVANHERAAATTISRCRCRRWLGRRCGCGCRRRCDCHNKCCCRRRRRGWRNVTCAGALLGLINVAQANQVANPGRAPATLFADRRVAARRLRVGQERPERLLVDRVDGDRREIAPAAEIGHVAVDRIDVGTRAKSVETRRKLVLRLVARSQTANLNRARSGSRCHHTRNNLDVTVDIDCHRRIGERTVAAKRQRLCRRRR